MPLNAGSLETSDIYFFGLCLCLYILQNRYVSVYKSLCVFPNRFGVNVYVGLKKARNTPLHKRNSAWRYRSLFELYWQFTTAYYNFSNLSINKTILLQGDSDITMKNFARLILKPNFSVSFPRLTSWVLWLMSCLLCLFWGLHLGPLAVERFSLKSW